MTNIQRDMAGRNKRNVKKKISDFDGSPLDGIRQQERIEIIAEELVKMKSKAKIQNEYMKKWECSRPTINTIIEEAMLWLVSVDKSNREQMRTLNSNRLDYLFDEAKSVRDKSKLIDLLNKMYGLYEQNINIGGTDESSITFSFGGDGEPETIEEDESEDKD